MSQQQFDAQSAILTTACDADGGRTSAGGAKRMLVAVIIGLAFSFALWVGTPYNNYLLLNSGIADDYLPLGPIVIILMLVLGINPFIRAIRPRLALTGSQLGVIFAILLVAAVVPGFGLMRALPYMLARNPQVVNEKPRLVQQYDQMHLPNGMFPDKIQAHGKTPVGEGFTDQLRADQQMPWLAWARPAATWGVFILFAWMMMVALAAIVLPQWRDNERVAFPLLALQQAVIEEPAEGTLLPPIFRNRLFWAAAGVVFAVHLVSGLNMHMPNSVPAVPLAWKLGNIFTGVPWSSFEASVRDQRIYFAFVGLAFFMPTRIAFSMWFFVVAYGFYRMIGYIYLPPFYDGQMTDQRTGAMLGLALGVLWIGRGQWLRVACSLFARRPDEQTRRDRDSGWLFVAGLAGMVAWMTWVGLPLGWSIVLAGFGFLCALLISRMVAETGMPLMRLPADGLYLAKLAPIKLLSPIVLLMSQVMTVLFAMNSRVSASAMALQGAAVTGERRPRVQTRLTWLFLGVLVLGFVVAGPAHLWMNYHHDRAVNDQQVNGWGLSLLDEGNRTIEELGRGSVGRPPQNTVGHIAFGAIFAGVLYWLSLTFPTWPLHPMGLVLVQTVSYANKVWASLFFGWLLKVLLVRFGGAMAYRKAKAAFLGLIMGEVLAAVFWAIVQAATFNQNTGFIRVEVLPM